MSIFEKYSYKSCISPVSKAIFLIDNQEYCWVGGVGTIFESKERKPLSLGTIRVIARTPFYVYRVDREGLFTYKICWSLPDVDPQWLREFKSWIFH